MTQDLSRLFSRRLTKLSVDDFEASRICWTDIGNTFEIFRPMRPMPVEVCLDRDIYRLSNYYFYGHEIEDNPDFSEYNNRHGFIHILQSSWVSLTGDGQVQYKQPRMGDRKNWVKKPPLTMTPRSAPFIGQIEQINIMRYEDMDKIYPIPHKSWSAKYMKNQGVNRIYNPFVTRLLLRKQENVK